jgi:hypothetical protein
MCFESLLAKPVCSRLLNQPQGASPRFEPRTRSIRGLAPCG